MPLNQTTVKSTTTQQCLQACANQRANCLTFNSGRPSPATAFSLQQCHTNYNKCANACTTNNIRPYVNTNNTKKK